MPMHCRVGGEKLWNKYRIPDTFNTIWCILITAIIDMCKYLVLSTMIFCSDHDDCMPDPCQNGGACTDDINDYTCNCTQGWEGKNCTISKTLS